MIYFGTDGIRGIVGEDVTDEVCFKCGNAVASLKKKAKIIIGTDTRTSKDLFLLSFSSGAVLAGAEIFFVGIVPSPAISFLVQKCKADFGVMITASHNPAEHNGIKIFNCDGEKIDVKTQTQIERLFAKKNAVSSAELGKFHVARNLAKKYFNFVVSSGTKLDGLKVVLDTANGASSSFAGKIFKKLGAEVVRLSCSHNGKLINKNCGAIHPERLAQAVRQFGADVGFAFDGDADRIVMVDEKGNICSGDQIILFLAQMYGRFGMLKTGAIVATIQSNMALETELEKCGLKLIRTDVGDQFVTQELKKRNLQIGGEQSGHIILFDYEKTGDGVFCAVQICKFLKLCNEPISKNLFWGLLGQHEKNIITEKKYEIINSAKFKVAVSECEKLLGKNGRIVTRASGTENKIRLMVECDDKFLATQILNKLESATRD